MEGKELNNDDDHLKSGSDENTNEESDDFGLPEAPFDDQKEETSEESEAYSFSTGDSSETEEGTEKFDKSEAISSYTEESGSPVGLIVTLIIIGVVAIVVAAYFLFFNKDKEEQVVVEEPVPAVVDSTLLETPVEEPVVEEEPVEEEPEPAMADVGEYLTISEKTGRYYVVIGSFIDADLAEDYAKKLAKDGVNTTILSPEGKGFHRLALEEDYGSFADASMQLETFRGNYGPEVWVLKY